MERKGIRKKAGETTLTEDVILEVFEYAESKVKNCVFSGGEVEFYISFI